MKQSTPLRRDPEKARAWLHRSAPLHTTSPIERDSTMRSRSTKRIAEDRVRAKLRQTSPGICEIRYEGCTTVATDWHERLSRARGGSITDPVNRVMVCRSCHSFLTDHPVWAEANGWSLHSWDQVPS